MLNEMRPAARRFIVLTVVLGLACVIWAITTVEWKAWGGPVLLGAMALMAELYPVRLSKQGTVSVAAAINFAAVILFPPQVAIVTTATAGGLGDVLGKVPPVKTAFNTAQLAVAAAVASAVYHLGPDGSFIFRVHGPWGLAAGLAFLFANSFFICTIIALVDGHSPFSVWRTVNRDMILHDLTLYPIGMLLAIAYQHDIMSILLFALPMVFIYVSFNNFVVLRTQTRQVLETLADIIDRRDPYTAEHSKRVAHYAQAIAEEMELPDDQVALIESAARVHDLGKITWRDSILLKPGKLTEDELKQVRKHPVTGAQIVKSLWNYRNGVPLIRHHHERLDGTGYPDGLPGYRIPLGARILSVADAYDAMTSDRPYRRALPHAEAVRRLREGAGSQFDPEVVQAFIRWMENNPDKIAPAREEAAAADEERSK